jgi:demethylmenaquinone methyltransferase/2-methoxy-6-polyprenyl-1,4-benzoquinol methylase
MKPDQQTHPIMAKRHSWQMFNQISAQYDLCNHLLSLGGDIRWRKTLVRYFPTTSEQLMILDLATGTADVLICLTRDPKLGARIYRAVGVDLAENMLTIGREKVHRLGLDHIIQLRTADAHCLPFAENDFHAVSMAFGIRNVENPVIVLKEMYRVLKTGGHALILEFSMPSHAFIRLGHLAYLRGIVPLVGGLISGHFRAYRYLNQSVERFPYGEHFCRLMRQVGFQNVRANPLFLGVASIYQGEKP